MRVMLDDMDLAVISRVTNEHGWEGREITG